MTPSKGLRQAYDIQDFAYEATIALRNQCNISGSLRIDPQTVADLHKLASTWSAAQERIAFHRRVPSPGSLRPEARKTKRPRRAAPMTATVAPVPDPATPPTSDAATNTAPGDGATK